MNKKYKCGHRQEIIVLDSSLLSMSAYLDWIKSYGYNGDKSMCWKCYCSQNHGNQHQEAENEKT